MRLKRRDFLRLSGIAAGLTALGAAPEPVERRNEIPYRVLGRSGEKVSLLGLGGFHIGVDSLSEEQSIRLMRTAADEGINFFDNAHMYHDGRSEERMGKALRDGYRDKVFLMTKFFSDERDVPTAEKQLEESLTRLQTDVIDLWQVHLVRRASQPKAVYEGGLLDFLTKAREQGKVRYIGFTGHTRPEYLAEMIERGFEWDSVQMPINPLDHHWVSFQGGVMPKALKNNIGVIAMKTLGGSLRKWPGEIPANSGVLTAAQCHRFVLNLPVSTLVSGMDSMDVLEKNMKTVREFEPLGEDEVVDILARCEEAAQGGQFEPYKKDKIEL